MERAVPGRQEAVRPAVLDCKKAEPLGDRSLNRSNRTNRRAADRPRRVIDQAKLKPTKLPANTTTSKGAKASSRSYFSSSARPRSHNDPAATGHEQEHHTRTPRTPSFHRNVSSTVPSIRSSVVPAERQTADPIVPARRLMAFFDSPPPNLSTLRGRAKEPTSRPANANRLTPSSSQLTKASRLVHPQAIRPLRPQSVQPQSSMSLQRRTVDPLIQLGIDQGSRSSAQPGWLGFVLRRILDSGHPQIGLGGEAAFVWAGWIGFACGRHARQRRHGEGANHGSAQVHRMRKGVLPHTDNRRTRHLRSYGERNSCGSCSRLLPQ